MSNDELKKQVEQLQAQVEALQNKCAQRGLSPEDSDRLQTRCEKLEKRLHALYGLKSKPEELQAAVRALAALEE